MKRVALLLLVAMASVAVLLPVFAHSSVRDGTLPGPHEYTFDQAVKAVIVPSLQAQLKESGLPLCPPPSEGIGGYKSAEALKQAIDKAPEAPTCMADPRGISVSVCNAGDSCLTMRPVRAAQAQQSVIPAAPGAWPHVQ